jgi:hypothetical protein
MPSVYTSGGYIKPPRAEIVRDPSALPGFEGGAWIAQIKKNGTNSIIFVSPERQVVGWNRHGEKHRAWQFTEPTAAIFKDLPGKGWFVFHGELLHNKTPKIKNQHYLYDILVCDGIHLTGTTYEFRYQLLFDILAQGMAFDCPTASTQYFRLDPFTSIARNYTRDFAALFASLTAPEDEGLVLRRREGVYTGPKADSWMVKFRDSKKTKLY